MLTTRLTPRLSTLLPRRPSPSSSLRFSSSIPSRIYPDLYYHPLDSSEPQPTSYSLSYLPTPPPSLTFSPTTIGLVRPLPASPPSSNSSSSSAGDEPGKAQEDPRLPPITPRTFQENSDFLKLVHTALREAVEGDLWLQTQAKSMEGADTYIHIPDHRCPASHPRLPAPQDILSSLLVQSGQLVPSSYEANSVAYRLVSEDGLMRLPEGLHAKVVEACRRVREVEVEVAGGQGGQE
ncbi:hypothetical protein JCM6882_007559 [Rhodosporidiobolus microsporus]